MGCCSTRHMMLHVEGPFIHRRLATEVDLRERQGKVEAYYETLDFQQCFG